MDDFTIGLKNELFDNLNINSSKFLRTFLTVVIKFAGKLTSSDSKVNLTLKFDSQHIQDLFIKSYEKYFEITPIKKDGLNLNSAVVNKNVISDLGKLQLIDDKEISPGLPPEIVNESGDVKLVALKTVILLKGNLVSPKNQFPFFISFDNLIDAMAVKGITRKFEIESYIKSDGGRTKLLIKDRQSVLHLLEVLGTVKTYTEWKELHKLTLEKKGKKLSSIILLQDLKKAYELLGDDLDEQFKVVLELRLNNQQLNLEEIAKMCEPPISKDAVSGRLKKILQMYYKKVNES